MNNKYVKKVCTYGTNDMVRHEKETQRSYKAAPPGIRNLLDTHPSKGDSLPLTPFQIFTKYVSQDEPLLMYKYLLKLTTCEDELIPDDGLVIWLNIFLLANPNCLGSVRAILTKFGFDVELGVDIFDWIEDSRFKNVDLRDLTDLEELTSGHVCAWIGIHMVLMGRYLTNQNVSAWLSRRRLAFAAACGVDDSNPSYQALLPSLIYCQMVNKSVASRHELRQLTFQQIYGLGTTRTDQRWYNTYKTSLVFLAGTELSLFVLINQYIVCENPILLAWNELSKQADKLLSAYRKWVSLGDAAPYCKLLYGPDDVAEFNRKNLSIFADIAIAIAQMEGVASLRHYKGGSTSEERNPVVEQALIIVRSYGGANTHVTNALRSDLLANDIQNNELLNTLSIGGNEVIQPINDPVNNQPIQVPIL